MLQEALSAGIGTLIRVPLAKGLLGGRYFERVDLPADDLRYERFQLPEIQAARRELPRLTALTNGGGDLVNNVTTTTRFLGHRPI